jgi:hypothetical protein
MLIGIIGLAGLPPMNGFVSKWLIYRSLILEGSPLLDIKTYAPGLDSIPEATHAHIPTDREAISKGKDSYA